MNAPQSTGSKDAREMRSTGIESVTEQPEAEELMRSSLRPPDTLFI
jgi:hypothetical protein